MLLGIVFLRSNPIETFETGKGACALHGQAGRANPAAAAVKLTIVTVRRSGNHRPLLAARQSKFQHTLQLVAYQRSQKDVVDAD
jgi:adenosylmethionine-8-amino-7-oxononanoate aminotransferase